MIAAYLPRETVHTRVRRAWSEHVAPALEVTDQGLMLSALVVASTCVDEIVAAEGYPGPRAGARLWIARRSFSQFDALVEARRMRNRAVHHLDYRLHHQGYVGALASFAVALRDHGLALGDG
ncbi:MAG TPA: hypothetical protein PKD53_18640 [Chloroflexaceae bacterium]|nr:hypothetical protein [Chloroflexaceae bacterium]